MFNFNKYSLREEKNKIQKNFECYNVDKEDTTTESNNICKNYLETLNKFLSKIDIKSCSNTIFKKEENKLMNRELIYNYFNSNLMVFSNINQALYILFPKVQPMTKNIIYQFFCVFENSDKNVEIKEYFLKFSPRHKKKNIKNIKYINFRESDNDEEQFLIKAMDIHSKNENQLCFFSEEKIAFIKDLNKLLINKNENIIDIYISHEINKHDKTFFYKKFKFSDFDNYYGILSSDNIFNLYSLNDDLSETTIDLESNVTDFEFGRSSKHNTLLPFSLFFLKESGEILFCNPIFPKILNNDYIIELHKNNLYINQKLENINLKDEQTNFDDTFLQGYDTYNSMHKNKPNNQDLFKDKLYLKIIQNLIDCNEYKLKELIIASDHHLNKGQTKKFIEINDYLNSFNKNLRLQKIYISDKRKSLSNEENYLKTSSNKYISDKSYFKKYNQILVLPVYPITILRVLENNIIEVITLLDDIKPNDPKNKINNEEQDSLNAVLTEVHIFKRYFDIENSDLKLIKNKLNPNKILINYINDVYLLNLKLPDFISETVNSKIKKEDCYEKSQDKLVYKYIEMQKVIKIDYLKNKNIYNKNLSYIGIDFINFKNNNMNYILFINADPYDKFVSHIYPISNKKDNNVIKSKNEYKFNSRSEYKNFRRFRHHFEKLFNNKNTNDFFTKLEEFYKIL